MYIPAESQTKACWFRVSCVFLQGDGQASVVKNLPDVSFIDGKTVEEIRGEMVADYEAFMSQATGRPLTLDRASPHRMELYAA